MPNPSFARASKRCQQLAIFLAGVLLAVGIGLLGAARFAPMERLDNAFLDAFVRLSTSPAPAQATRTVAIDIDDASLSAVGQWPWPRYRIAAMIQRIAAEKPAAIALDILFPEADRSSLDSIRRTFKHDFDIDIAITGVPEGLRDNDGFLGQQIANADVVGSRYFYFDRSTRSDGPLKSLDSIDGRTDLLAARVATGVLSNADEIALQTRTTGFINSISDADGVLRRQPLLISQGGTLHPSLALAAAMRATGVSSATISADPAGLALRIGPHRVPIERNGFATVRLEGKPSFYPSISAVDILNGNFRPADLRGKVVFIGSSAVGLSDLHATAVDPAFPGLKIQSAMVENILGDKVIATPSWTAAATVVACALLGTLMSALFVRAGGAWSFVYAGASASAVLVAASALLFARAGQFVSPGAPLLVVLALGTLLLVTRAVIDRRRAATARRQLENSRQVTIESMAAVAETRDPETGGHIKRTQHYVRAIARELKRTGHHRELLTDAYIDLLFLSAPLHDIGKVGVPDHILLKPGRLTPEEMEIMKQHAEFGRKIVHSTAARIEGDNFLVIAGEIAATHHEKWDGTGYPLGLAADAIPLSGRIMAAADIYDALISRRCYKEPFTHAHSTQLMREMRGTTFDPAVLDAFFRIESTIIEIAQRFRDEPETTSGDAGTAAQAPPQVSLPVPPQSPPQSPPQVPTNPGRAGPRALGRECATELAPDAGLDQLGAAAQETLTPAQRDARAAASVTEMMVDC